MSCIGRQTQQFGLYSILDHERAELEYAFRQSPYLGSDMTECGKSQDGLAKEKRFKPTRGQGSNGTRVDRLSPRGARTSINCSDFAEHRSDLQIRENDCLTFRRIDDHTNFAGSNKKNLSGRRLIAENCLSSIVVPPVTGLSHRLQLRWRQHSQDRHPLEGTQAFLLIHQK